MEAFKGKSQTSGKSQWSKEACRKHLAAGLYFLEASSANPVVGKRVLGFLKLPDSPSKGGSIQCVQLSVLENQ